MAKYAAFGTTIQRETVGIVQVQKIDGPDLSLDLDDATSHDSSGAWEESVATILRSGTITMDILYDPNHATHKNAAGGLIADMVSRATHNYTLTFPSSPAVSWSFDAFVVGFKPTAPYNGKLAATVNLKLDGAPTLA